MDYTTSTRHDIDTETRKEVIKKKPCDKDCNTQLIIKNKYAILNNLKMDP